MFGAFGLYLSLYPSALIFYLSLARLLLDREPKTDGGERERDYEWLQEVVDRLISEQAGTP